MMRVQSRLALVLACLALCGAWAGCTNGNFSPIGDVELAVLGHAPPSGNLCVSEPGRVTLSVMDLVLAEQYIFYASLENRSPEPLSLTGARLSFRSDPDADVLPFSDVDVTAGGTVLPGQQAVVPVVLINRQLAKVLRFSNEFRRSDNGDLALGASSEVVATIELRAQSVTGRSVIVNQIEVPISVCVGCLIEHPPDALNPGEDGSPTCGLGNAEMRVNFEDVKMPCLMGQDLPVDCRVCRARAADDTQANLLCDP